MANLKLGDKCDKDKIIHFFLLFRFPRWCHVNHFIFITFLAELKILRNLFH